MGVETVTTTCDVCFKETSKNYSDDNSTLCQECWEKKISYSAYLKEKAMNTTNDYGTSIGVIKFVSFVGWVAVIAGTAITIMLIRAGEMALLGIPSSITVALIGLLMVVSGQASRAVMDTANYAKAMLEIMKQNKN